MHPYAHRAGALVPAPSAAVDGAGAASASAADARPRGQQTGTGDDCVGIFFCDLSVPDPKGCEVCAAHVCNLIDAEVRAPPQPRPAPAHQPRPAPRAAAAARRGSRARGGAGLVGGRGAGLRGRTDLGIDEVADVRGADLAPLGVGHAQVAEEDTHTVVPGPGLLPPRPRVSRTRTRCTRAVHRG